MKPIAIVDSGIGGIPYLEEIRRLLPGFPLVYCADNLGFPYGTKNPEAIIATFSAMVERLIAAVDPELFVVACNTASIVALDYLRERYPYHFVGVVPAVKPAALVSKSRVIGVLATRRTVEHPYLQGLVDQFATDCTIVRLPATDLIARIESDPFAADRPALEALIDGVRTSLQDAGADTLVLACTHFLVVRELFFAVLGPGFMALDSREGVARQVVRVLEERGLGTGASPALPGRFYLTGPAPAGAVYAQLAASRGLDFGGVIGV